MTQNWKTFLFWTGVIAVGMTASVVVATPIAHYISGMLNPAPAPAAASAS